MSLFFLKIFKLAATAYGGPGMISFGRASLVDIPTILMAAAAFLAIYKKISLFYVLLSGGILSVFLFGLLK